MNIAVTALFEALLLAAALSFDAFMASFAYGVKRIKIPFRSAAVISLICAFSLAASLLCGHWAERILPPAAGRVLCFSILFLLGIIKLFDGFIKAYIAKTNFHQKNIRFELFNLKFILSVYAQPERADLDSSNVLSPLEAAPLAAALSLDGVAVGFGAGAASFSLFLVTTLALLTSALAVLLGGHFGNRCSKLLTFDFSLLAGAILILLAFVKLL